MPSDEASLSPQDMEHFRDLLKEKQGQLASHIRQMEQELSEHTSPKTIGESSIPTHPADRATDQYDQDLTIRLLASQRDLLREVDEALQRIADGTYGTCQGTGEPISRKRLEAKPWARFSIEYERRIEGM